MSLGSEIKEVRVSLGMSQTKFAEKVGVTFVTVSRWEKDKNQPHDAFLAKIRRLGEKA